MVRCVLVFAIFYNVTAGNRDNLILPTVEICGRFDLWHFNLRDIVRAGIAVFVKILVDNKNRRETYCSVNVTAVSGVEKNFCIKHNKSKRLVNSVLGVIFIPAKSCVHSTNYVAVAVGFCPRCLLRHNSGLVVTVYRNHSIIAVNNLNVFIVQVSFHNKKHLSARAVVVVQNNLRLGDTGSDIPILLGYEIVIVVSACGAVDGVIVACKCRKRNCCEGTENHHKRKNE